MSKSKLTVSDVDDLKRKLDPAMRKHGRWIYGQPARALDERWDDDRKVVVLPYQVPDDEVVAICNTFSTTTDDLWSVTFDCRTDQGQQLIDRVVVEIAGKQARTEAGGEARPRREKEPRWDVQVRGTRAYNRIREHKAGKIAACNLEGIDPRTYDSYLEKGWIPLEDKDME